MKKTFIPVILISLFCCIIQAQTTSTRVNNPERPKLVVGIVVDQMRWDFLYRYYSKYETGGFKRLLNEGFSCENTMINYIPSVTAIGHTTIFTGSVPAIHGIAGNDWYNPKTGKSFYCTDDSTVTAVGTTGKGNKMSPRNLLVTTITDELRLATNFQSKVVGYPSKTVLPFYLPVIIRLGLSGSMMLPVNL